VPDTRRSGGRISESDPPALSPGESAIPPAGRLIRENEREDEEAQSGWLGVLRSPGTGFLRTSIEGSKQMPTLLFLRSRASRQGKQERKRGRS